MSIDYFFTVSRPNARSRDPALSFVLPRAGSMGPFLARYAKLHTKSPKAPYQYSLTAAQWNGFMEELYARQALIRDLADCILSFFDFDPDSPDEIREPLPADWEKLARFEHWVIRVFGRSANGSPEPVFSLDRSHFERGVLWAYELSRWLDLDPEIREALRDPQALVFLDIG